MGMSPDAGEKAARVTYNHESLIGVADGVLEDIAKGISLFQASDDERGTLQPVQSTTGSPSGSKPVSGSHDQTLRLRDSFTGEARCAFKGHSNGVCSVAFSPDGKLLASGSSDDTVRLWDSATGEAHSMLKNHNSGVCSVAFSPDGSWQHRDPVMGQ
ncbi:MAG: hypothetical protein M1840_002073 [Geoglossum simile]|nr:MAG: hypothetical protein M1840_002073 [Geoglossum simile]